MRLWLTGPSNTPDLVKALIEWASPNLRIDAKMPDLKHRAANAIVFYKDSENYYATIHAIWLAIETPLLNHKVLVEFLEHRRISAADYAALSIA
jgi:hypothetical protein